MDFGGYVNFDEIVARLEESDLDKVKKAKKITESQRNNLRQTKMSHSFEPVMSHPGRIKYIVQAKDDGFDVILLFIDTNDPQKHLARVADRVEKGGHAVTHRKDPIPLQAN
ncbi:hypothetical protein BTJ40_13405 [Microbulbifer sp. A4B17]|uniref:hypothetical protein n=1 Tax=Microbulbifer sp. A4B17 TaxID=359370 RepID=UPI000D52B663|nr:hypothetical protein [Microbulbifer sp. A4B17]AWF81742.1 hypothetical protein BTJ40_13405 [Microbulbifer sp. A4B17]